MFSTPTQSSALGRGFFLRVKFGQRSEYLALIAFTKGKICSSLTPLNALTVACVSQNAPQRLSNQTWNGSAHAALNQTIVRPNTMNDYTEEICDVVKAKGIILYTITFGVRNQPAKDLM